MFEIWKKLGGLAHLDLKKVAIHNWVFQLHCKATTLLLLIFSILVTSRQYIGNPIDCISSDDVKKIADEYCWIHSTFTRARNESGTWIYEAVGDDDEIEPGIRPAVSGDTLNYNTYYQWVWAILFLQAALFYIPHWIWKNCEHGRLRTLVGELNVTLVDPDELERQARAIVNYLSLHRGRHTLYATQHAICEGLNLANVLLQMYLTDAFVNGGFSGYGLRLFEVANTKPFLRHDPLAKVFPTMTACRISTGGLAFGTAEYDLLCVLPINILNEKIYIFIWFWFIFLGSVSFLAMVYRGFTFIPQIRVFLTRRKVRFSHESSLKEFLSHCDYGDWFLIDKMGQNMDPVTFDLLLKELARNDAKNNSTEEHFLLKATP